MSASFLASVLFLQFSLAILYIYSYLLLYLTSGWVLLFIIRLLYKVGYLFACLHIIYLLYIVALRFLCRMVLCRTEVYSVSLLTSFYLHLQEVQVVRDTCVSDLHRWIVLYVQVTYWFTKWCIRHRWVVLIKIVQIYLILVKSFLQCSSCIELCYQFRMLDLVHVMCIVRTFRSGSIKLITLDWGRSSFYSYGVA